MLKINYENKKSVREAFGNKLAELGEKYPNIVKIAIAYDFQVTDAVNNSLIEKTDIKPDMIVTEKRIIHINQ